MKSINVHLFYFYLSFFVLVACKSEAQKEAERHSKIKATLFEIQKKEYKTRMDSILNGIDFNGSIVVYNDSMLVYRLDRGFGNFARKLKINEESVFAIGSITKQFTGALLFYLEEEGKLKISEKASKYVQEFETPLLRDITIQQLLNHTSGITDGGKNLKQTPGTEFNYSNKGYQYLGILIEKSSGKSYSENCEILFQKAGLQHTYTPKSLVSTNLAIPTVGDFIRNSTVPGMPHHLETKGVGTAAGGVLSTANDLRKWNAALYQGKILSPFSLQKFLKPSSSRKHPIFGNSGYCNGLMINSTAPLAFFHSGYVKGSASLNVYYPNQKTTVIVLSNLANESKGIQYIFKNHLKVKNTSDRIQYKLDEAWTTLAKSAARD